MENEILYKSVSCWNTGDVSSWIKERVCEQAEKRVGMRTACGVTAQVCTPWGAHAKLSVPTGIAPGSGARQNLALLWPSVRGASNMRRGPPQDDANQLYYLKVDTVGHQELVLEGIELLCALEKSLTQNSTIALASNLSKKASQLTNALTSANRESGEVDEKLSLRCKDLAGGVMMAAKNLVSWSDRHPTNLISDYTLFRQDVLKNALELSCMMQARFDGQQALGACQGLLKLTRSMMTPQHLSSVAPIQLSAVKLRPKGNTGLGISVKRTKQGALLITQVIQRSPADESKIQVGSEVVQINNQNVIGWAIANVVDTLKASCHEVTLVLQVGAMQQDDDIDDVHLDMVSPVSPGETSPTMTKETSLTSLEGTSPTTPTTPMTPTTPPTPTMGVPKETTADDENPVFSPERVSSSSSTRHSPTPPPKISPASQPKLAAQHNGNVSFEMSRAISASLQDVTGANIKKQQLVPQSREITEDVDGKSRSVWYHLDVPPSSSPPVHRVEGPFEKRLHGRTSSDPSSPTPAAKTVPSMEYPPVAYRTAVVGGVVIRIPITSQPDDKGIGSKSPNKKKSKKVHLDVPDKGLEHEVKRGKTVFSEPKDVSIEGHIMKQVTVSGEASFSQESVAKDLGKKVNPSLMVPCFQLKDVDLEGWMSKLGGSGLTPKNWRKRWFVLKDRRLFYYKTAFDVSALGIVDLGGYQVEPAPEMKKKSGINFKLFKDHDSRVYHFQVETQEEMTRWIEALRKASSLPATAGQSTSGAAGQSTSGVAGQSTSGVAGQTAHGSDAAANILPQQQGV